MSYLVVFPKLISFNSPGVGIFPVDTMVPCLSGKLSRVLENFPDIFPIGGDAMRENVKRAYQI